MTCDTIVYKHNIIILGQEMFVMCDLWCYEYEW